MATEEENLWTKYRSAGDREAYESIVSNYLPLVKVTAGRLALNLPRQVLPEDLYSAGCVGLLSAIERFDLSRETKFETYAAVRIKGAMLDELRSMDLVTRGTRDRANKIRDAEERLRDRGEDLSCDMIAAEAGLSLDEYLDTELALRASQLASLNEDDEEASAAALVKDDRTPGPLDQLEREELRDIVNSLLDDRERELIIFYYYEHLTLKEIGTLMHVTESRVCQLHTAVIKKLQFRLAKL